MEGMQLEVVYELTWVVGKKNPISAGQVYEIMDYFFKNYWGLCGKIVVKLDEENNLIGTIRTAGYYDEEDTERADYFNSNYGKIGFEEKIEDQFIESMKGVRIAPYYRKATYTIY